MPDNFIRMRILKDSKKQERVICIATKPNLSCMINDY
jgi:hypothetical protein